MPSQFALLLAEEIERDVAAAPLIFVPAPAALPPIAGFFGEFRFLSNFWYASVVLDGVRYPSVENAYQAAKTVFPAIRVPFEDMKPGEAKRAGRALPIRPDWDAIRLATIADLLAQKFAPGTELALRLAATGERPLIEANTWNDRFFGAVAENGGYAGSNRLGRLLMALRARNRGLEGARPGSAP